MKKIVLIFAIIILTVSSAISQTTWLPIQIKEQPCGLTIDSVSIYNIAENKRKLDALIVNSNIQKEISESYKLQYIMYQSQYIELKSENERLVKELNSCLNNSKKLKKNRIMWGLGGALIGAITYSILVN